MTQSAIENRQSTITAVDLCGGAGGWACAAAGLPVRIVAAVDLWPACCRTYRLNHSGVEVIEGDVREAKVQECITSMHPDLVLGAIPCQWLTVRRSEATHNAVGPEELAQERRTLRAVLDLVERIKPRWWCLEDVVQLRRELPEGTPFVTLEAKHFSPQSRRRLYVGRFPSPILRRDSRTLADCLRPGPWRIGTRAADRAIGRSKTFSPDLLYSAYPARKCPTICSLSSRRDAEFCVIDPAIPGGRRQLEWQEAARAQGFPDDYVFYGSPTAVWGMIGQAIQIDTGRAILKEIVSDWKDSQK